MASKAKERPPWTQTVAFGLSDADVAAMDRRRRKHEGDLTVREAQVLDWLYRGRNEWARGYLLPEEMLGHATGTERPECLWVSEGLIADVKGPDPSAASLEAYTSLRRSIQLVLRSLEQHGAVESIRTDGRRRAYRYRAGAQGAEADA